MDALERRAKSRAVGKAEAAGADRAGENDLQAIGAVFEIGQREFMGGGGLGMIEAGDDTPVAGGAEGARLSATLG